MKKIITAALLTVCISAFAQPTITSSVLPVKGDTIFLALDTILQPPGNGGANITWDFSNLPQHFLSSRIYIDPATTPYFSEFPSATLARTDAYGSVYTYWKNVGNTSTYFGFVEPLVPNDQNYDSIPLTYYSFPINYNDSVVRSFYSTTNPGNLKSAGKYYFKADGWGTLKLPHRTISNVLRSKSLMYIGDSTINSYSLTKEVTWYSPNQKDILLVINSVVVNGALTRKYIFFDNHYNTGISSVETSNYIHVYPNPSNGIFKMDIENSNTKCTIDCFDFTGRLVLNKEIETHATIDLSGFGKGIYILKIKNASFETVKKVVVE